MFVKPAVKVFFHVEMVLIGYSALQRHHNQFLFQAQGFLIYNHPDNLFYRLMVVYVKGFICS